MVSGERSIPNQDLMNFVHGRSRHNILICSSLEVGSLVSRIVLADGMKDESQAKQHRLQWRCDLPHSFCCLVEQ
jgi:hypothetical protein